MRTLGCTLLACTLLAPALAAQTNLERMTNDRYTRSHDYDLVHQRIELTGISWDSLSFDGKVTSTLVSLRPGLDSVILDAGHLLDITRATAGNTSLRTSRHGDTLVVHLAAPAAFGDTVRFAIDYAARIDNGHGLTFKKAEAGHAHYPQQIWSQGEDDNNHDWFPTYDFPNDKLTWELVATVPAEYTVVSNGKLISDTKSAGGHTVHWSQEEPSASYLVSLVVAPLAKVSDTWRGKPVDYYVYREDSALAMPLFKVTPDMIEVYSQLTGVPYAWHKYAQTTVADFFGGMENVSATTLVDWLPDARAYQDRPWYQYILIPHELAHQWFGDYVTTENWANMWLNEGFAEFMPGQYWGEKLGRHAEEDYYLDEYRQFMAIDQRRRMPVAALGSNNIYPRGALILEMLQHQLGAERFWAGIHRYLTDHKFDNATTDDLRQAILDATGQNLDDFWNQWIYQAGYPEFTVSQAYDATTHRLTLAVKQTQVDTATADSTGLRYTTPQVFQVPVTVRVGTAQGDRVVAARIDAREDTITVDSVMSAPAMVIFDDGNAILKKLTFEQPTAQLARQLEQDPDLWNRQWVIEQLAARPTDKAAGAALANAALRADYYLTRAEAAAALDSFPASVAVKSLRAALKDSSSAVRGAALGALAGLEGARRDVIKLAARAWKDDPSYQVRAAALEALIVADSAHRAEHIRTGLRTPSYRDDIQNAALSAMVRFPGAVPASEIEPLLGQQQLPAYLLAALARRGDSTAMGILVRHVDDDRGWVREWVLNAFQNAMPRQVAARALQPVVGSLKHEDARKAVEELLKPASGQQPGR
jgi:aminopeptidase N